PAARPRWRLGERGTGIGEFPIPRRAVSRGRIHAFAVLAPPEGWYAGLMDEYVGRPIMDEAAAHTVRLSDEDVLRERVAELAADLRAAAMKGDTLRITRLLSDLLQFKRLTPERRLALEGLTHLIDSMRSLALTDELTGIHNRRGFLQAGKRFLDVARRELRSAYLVY